MSKDHKNLYKNTGMDSKEMRRRRVEEGIQLRKEKREQQLTKRRNIVKDYPDVACAGDDTVAVTQDRLQQIPSSLPNKSEEQQKCQQHMPQQADYDLTNNDVLQQPTTMFIENDIIDSLYSEVETLQLIETQTIRKLLSKDLNPPIDEVVQKGIIPRFIEFLTNNNNTALQLEAACALCNIAFGNSQQTEKIIEAGAIPIFIELLRSPNDDVQELALCALGNIAGDSPASRDLVLDSGIMQTLLFVSCMTNNLTMVQSLVWTLSNLCRGKNPPVDVTKVVECLPFLAKLLDHADSDVLCDTCYAISFLSDGPYDKIQAVIDVGVCQRLVDLLIHPQSNVAIAALRAIGNIVTGNDVQTQIILDCNPLPNLKHLLNSTTDTIKMGACWTISNIAAGNVHQIQAVIDANIFPILIDLMQRADFKTRKEAAWTIMNATSCGTETHISYLVYVGCIPPICDFLTVADSDIVQVALTALENILRAGEKFPESTISYVIAIEKCGGLDKIELLQSHENLDI